MKIESDSTIANVHRANDALENMINKLDVKLVDWAFWDDTYQFAIDQNSAYADSNLGMISLSNLEINGFVLVDDQGNVMFAKMFDYHTHTELPMDGIISHLRDHPELTTHPAERSPVSGLISLPEGVALVVSEPVLTSQATGPVQGTLIFVKLLRDDEILEIGKLTHLDVSIVDYASKTPSADMLSARATLADNDQAIARPLSNDLIAGYVNLHDLYGEHISILRITTPRPIFLQGRQTLATYGLMMGSITPFLGFLVLATLQRLIFFRLTRLNKELENVSNVTMSARRVTEGSVDELGELEMTINRMLQQISNAEIDLEKFKLAVDSTDEHVIMTDAEGKILYANASAERITGYSLQEMLGQTPSLWGRQMTAAFYKKLWKAIARDHQSFAGEIKNKRKNGEIYIASASVYPILDEHGQIRYFVGIERDITKQRQAEDDLAQVALDLKKAKESVDIEVKEKTKELNEERARFLASVNSLPIGFTIIDTDGSLMIHNPVLLALLDSGESLGTIDAVSSLLGADVKLTEKLRDCTGKRCTAVVTEIPFKHKYLRIFIAPVFADGGDGHSLGGVLLIEDITEAKAIEKTKTEFVSLASHQLRTPLSTINWYVEMLQSGDAGKLTSEQKTFLDEIGVGNRRMVTLVNSLLNVSRLELGHLSVTAKPTKLQELIKSVVADAQEKIGQQKLTINESYEDLAEIPLDAKYVRMVVENIISNALKYTPEGGKVDVVLKKLEVGSMFGRRSVTETSVGLSIADTGYGIPEHQQNKMFEKLFRADNVLDKDEEGTGLGLYITKQIVDQSGGQIWFESKENVGTTFYVTLPFAGMKSQNGTKTLT